MVATSPSTRCKAACATTLVHLSRLAADLVTWSTPYLGFARIGELSGERRWVDAAAFFWEIVTRRRSVAFGGNSVREHFNPAADFSSMIESREGPETCNTYNMLRLTEGLFRADPRAVYADYTRVCYVGDAVPEKYTKIFDIVAAARDAGIKRVKDAFAAGEELMGWHVDAATRDVIEKAGYGEFFTHRTGHNIGQEVHGNGAHIDGLETRDDRRIIRRTCFSIEPGIYLPEFGVRSEVDVYIDAAGRVHVTGGDPQTEVHKIIV